MDQGVKPQIVSSYDAGLHNADLKATLERLSREGQYKDLSTIIIVPAFGLVPTKAVAAWWNLMTPPNQKVVKFFAMGMEVGQAYSSTIEGILGHPELREYKYLLTMEHDNVPPPDGILRLLTDLEEHPELACVGGLYFTKGPGGVAQIWGNPAEHPLNFKPQKPVPGGLVECSGTGMGFNLFRLGMFKDERLRKPWFKTVADSTGMMTQDLYFWQDARKYGYRCAIDCDVKVGHYDQRTDITW